YYADPDNWIGQMYDSNNWGTWKASAWYKNPKVDELLQKARSIVDQDERAKLYAEAARLVVDDAADLWIYNTVEVGAFRKNVMGWQFCPVGSGQDFWPMYLE
ncbi:MAG: ABC transporter substrate-binding protein, partial [Nitrospinota bacterium]